MLDALREWVERDHELNGPRRVEPKNIDAQLAAMEVTASYGAGGPSDVSQAFRLMDVGRLFPEAQRSANDTEGFLAATRLRGAARLRHDEPLR